MKPITTAEARKMARDAAARLDWARAADLMQLAISYHPAHSKQRMGQLDQLDLNTMTETMQSWRSMADQSRREASYAKTIDAWRA